MHALSCHALSYHALSCQALSYQHHATGCEEVHALSYHAPSYNTRCWDGKHISNQMFRVDLKQGGDRLLCIIYNRGEIVYYVLYITGERSFTMYIYKLMAGVTGPIYDYNTATHVI